MSKFFHYTKLTSQYYCSYSDEWEHDGVDFDYEVTDNDLLDAVCDILANEYFQYTDKGIAKQCLKVMISEQDMLDDFVEVNEEALHDYFMDEALDFFEKYVKNA